MALMGIWQVDESVSSTDSKGPILTVTFYAKVSSRESPFEEMEHVDGFDSLNLHGFSGHHAKQQDLSLCLAKSRKNKEKAVRSPGIHK